VRVAKNAKGRGFGCAFFPERKLMIKRQGTKTVSLAPEKESAIGSHSLTMHREAPDAIIYSSFAEIDEEGWTLTTTTAHDPYQN
jgi:hypothetical protein